MSSNNDIPKATNQNISSGSIENPIILDDSDDESDYTDKPKDTIAEKPSATLRNVRSFNPIDIDATDSKSLHENQITSFRAEAKRRWQEQRSQQEAEATLQQHDDSAIKPIISKKYKKEVGNQFGNISTIDRDDRDDRDDINPLPIKLIATSNQSCVDSQVVAKYSRTLRQLLGYDEGPEQILTHDTSIEWLIIFNYMIDFDYLLNKIPELLSIPKVVVFYGNGSSPHQWKQAAESITFQQLLPSDPPNSNTNPLSIKVPWGVHHTKMFLVGYSNSTIRVIIHTANLLEGDLELKTQGAYVQDFPLKQNGDSSQSISSEFEYDLTSYIDTYRFDQKCSWTTKTGNKEKRSLCDELKRYDFSPAKVILIPSTPGKNKMNKPKGYIKLSNAIKKYCVTNRLRASSATKKRIQPIVCQFSSIGSLSAKWIQDIANSWNVLALCDDCIETTSSAPSSSSSRIMKLVYPTSDEIRDSVEGYLGGGSVPGYRKNISKAFLQPLYHKWSSRIYDDKSKKKKTNPLHKPKNVPHIKTYYQVAEDEASLEWFCLTSHNLSKAAWGEKIMANEGRRIFTRHWELGVFISPQLYGDEYKLIPAGDDFKATINMKNHLYVPLPFQVIPDKYDSNDKPWCVDVDYSEKPDRWGRTCSG